MLMSYYVGSTGCTDISKSGGRSASLAALPTLASAVNCLRSQFVFYLLKSTQHQLPPVNNFNKLDNTTCNGSFNKVFSTPLHWPPPV